jgi:hypothetical protein
MKARRLHNRSVVRNYVAELKAAGLFEAVNAALPARARETIAMGRAMPPWVDSGVVDELFTALAAVAGRDSVRDLGRSTMKRGLGLTLSPVVSFILSQVGADPGSLLSRADSLNSLVTQGLHIEWKPGTQGGVVEMTACEPVPEIYWAVWEGALSTGFDLTRTTGVVHAAQPAADGRSCQFHVTWE